MGRSAASERSVHFQSSLIRPPGAGSSNELHGTETRERFTSSRLRMPGFTMTRSLARARSWRSVTERNKDRGGDRRRKTSRPMSVAERCSRRSCLIKEQDNRAGLRLARSVGNQTAQDPGEADRRVGSTRGDTGIRAAARRPATGAAHIAMILCALILHLPA